MNELKKQIQISFSAVKYPGDSNLRNSNEGEEPFLLEAAFSGKDDWRALASGFIDQAPDGYSSALSFFSAEAFQFYLPAYLLADLDDQLISTDLVFYLTYGFTDATKDVKVNPRRYGELTWYQYVSDRFSVFSREQAAAIVGYLQFKLKKAETDFERDRIDQGLKNFWEAAAKTQSEE